MDGINSPLFRLAAQVLFMGVLLFLAIPRQVAEMSRPRTQITKIRWVMLITLTMALLTSTPSAAYLYVRAIGHESASLREISTFTSSISTFSNTVFLIVLFTFKFRKEE